MQKSEQHVVLSAFLFIQIADFFIGNQTIRKNMVNVMRDQHWKDVRRTITPAFTPGRIEKVVTSAD